jgi:hypothetical protein
MIQSAKRKLESAESRLRHEFTTPEPNHARRKARKRQQAPSPETRCDVVQYMANSDHIANLPMVATSEAPSIAALDLSAGQPCISHGSHKN